jgi:drug/metabolite transporter (DMT)-like permease
MFKLLNFIVILLQYRMFKNINPSLALIYSTILWGTWWYPLRLLDEYALNNAIPLALSFLIGGFFVLYFALKEKISFSKRNLYLTLIAGILGGVAMCLYNEGIMRGSVARVLIFFYLTAVWSTMIEVFFLSKKLTIYRSLAITSGFIGLYIINGDSAFGLIPSSVADMCGLLAGISWSVCATFLRINDEVSVKLVTAICILSGAICVVIASFFPEGQTLAGFSLSILNDSYLLIILFSFVWIVPAYYLTCYGSDQVDPGKAGILMMLEVVIGISSAYLVANELITTKEAIGGIFILFAPLTELFVKKKEY